MADTAVQSAFKKLQDAQTLLASKKERLSNANATLASDTQKWSTTQLQFDGGWHARSVIQTLANQLASEISTMESTTIPNLQKLYDAAVKAEESANTAAFNIANPTAAVDVAKAKIEGATKAFIAQSTTKYLIWGAIALVVVVIGIIIYKKKFAKG
jgi:hypothetical protein